MKEISKPIRKVDDQDKIEGKVRYIADIEFEGMLFAKTLRSGRPRARIRSIEIPELPDGYFIVDANDIPGKNRVKMVINDHPFFAEGEVNYIGEPILLVVGPKKETIFEIIEKIKIRYEDLNPILTMEDAERKGKTFIDYEFTKGDPDKAFEMAEKVIEDEFRTGYQEHIYLEPQGVVGICEDGKVTIYGAMQCPYYVKGAVMEGLGWDEDRVRVVQTTTGGAFGGKEEYPSIIAGQVVVAALKTGRPVQLIFDRDEDIMVTTKRHPSVTEYRVGLDENGRITVLDINIKLDGGAYGGLSGVVLQRALFTATGVYNIPNLRVRGSVLKTNKVPSGAFRGFGAPQAIFGIEMLMHHLAEKLGRVPLDFKMDYALKTKDTTSTGGIIRGEVKLPEIIKEVEKMSDYRRKHKESRKFRGIGLSLFLHGCGFTGKGEESIKGKVTLRKKGKDVEILTSSVEMGQGATTTLRKIVSKSLSIPITQVLYDNPDTERVPDSGPTVASRTVMIVGGLLDSAAKELRERWDEGDEIEVSKIYKHPGYIKWDDKLLKGDAYPEYSWGANVVEVEIDPITYEIEVLGIWAVYDIGVAIDERIIQGQIEGGITQGLGYATIEVMDSVDGELVQRTLTDYKIPTSMDFPKIESKLVRNPYKYGPYGAKCAGELPFVGAAPALASAVENALSVPINRIPVTPEYLLEVLSG